MTTKLAAPIALLLATAACPIAATDFTPFGKRCSSSTCGLRYQCDANAGVCVPIADEGEGEGAATGEGEGAHVGEGEGASTGEGEGASTGEGEGAATGEGEGDCSTTGTACDCGVTRVCYAGQFCGPSFPACDIDDTCGLTDCTTDGTPEYVSCNNGLCNGVTPHLVVTMTWQGGADIDMHMSKRDALGAYCMDNFVDTTNFGGPAGSTVCGNGAPLDCWHNSCSADNLAETFVEWGTTTDEIPSYATLTDPVGDIAGVIFAVNQLSPGQYVVGGYYRDTGNGSSPTTVNVVATDEVTNATIKSFSFSIDTAQWKEFLHVNVDAENHVQCSASLLSASETNACPP